MIGTSAGFVMPYWSDGSDQSLSFLKRAIQSIYRQTDSEWRLFIVDDASKCDKSLQFLKTLGNDNSKVNVIFGQENRGPGYCRNLGIKACHDAGLPLVLFNDADDISEPRRLEVMRSIFESSQAVSVAYSHFAVIDEHDNLVPKANLSPSIEEILDVLDQGPPEGQEVWEQFGTTTGYVNLTSATAVLTSVAKDIPFPEERISEDFHTWLRYSGSGASFYFVDQLLTKYRIPSRSCSASRDRAGGAHIFARQKVCVDELGFASAISMAKKRYPFSQEKELHLWNQFYSRLSTIFKTEGYTELVQEIKQKQHLMSFAQSDTGAAFSILDSESV